jgi:hypothetical protein
MLPPAKIIEHEGIHVVRDDLISGGTKRRIAEKLLSESPASEFAYPSTAYGAAMIALAHAAKSVNKKLHIFLAERKKTTPFIDELLAVGGDINIHYVKGGFYSIVKSETSKFCKTNNIELIPCGFDFPRAIQLLSDEASKIKEAHGFFDIAVSVCSSGTLQRAMQLANLAKRYYAVGTGMKNPNHGFSTLIKHYEIQKFEQDSKILPPFPTVRNYDGKGWQYALELKAKYPDEKILFWNVSATEDDRLRV